MISKKQSSKHDVFVDFLREGWVTLHLDARCSGVVIPPEFVHEPHLILQFGHDMPIPIPDLEVTDEGVSATLSFWRTPHHTFVPWSAVYALASADGRGVRYHDDIPAEVSLPLVEEDDQAPRSRTTRATRTVPVLRSVPKEAPFSAEAIESIVMAARPRRRSQLRLVK
jgi:stringent starvation protein B